MPRQKSDSTLPLDPEHHETIFADDGDEAQEGDILVLYDARSPQRIGLTLSKNGIDYPITHILGPLDNKRYFEMQLEIEELAGEGEGVNSDLFFGPKHNVWKDIATGREGYKQRDDWREKTHPTDCAKAIDFMINIVMQDSKAEDAPEGELLFDEDELTIIKFNCQYNGNLLKGLSHSFRQETKAEMDAFMAIETGRTPDTLASAEKVSVAERLYRLGKSMLKEHHGYAPGSPIPAWHLAGSTRSFFLRQLSRMGKS